MPVTITNRWNGEPIATCEDTDDLREAVIRLTRRGVRLQGANLRSANLRYADLRSADLRSANLRSADLGYADLRSANLRSADLADIKSINWSSHDLLAEILLRAAGQDIGKRMVAGLILVSRDWCWEEFSKIEHPQRDWAIAELAKWVRKGDDVPTLIAAAAREPVAEGVGY